MCSKNIQITPGCGRWAKSGRCAANISPLTKSGTTAAVARPSITRFTAFRNLSFFMVFDFFSTSVGKTNGSMAKAGVFQLFCMSANCKCRLLSSLSLPFDNCSPVRCVS
jgi:hypothetical protein